MQQPTNGYCSGKVCFSKRAAQTKQNQLEYLGRERLRIYHCPRCNWWHLTHQTRRWSDKNRPYGKRK